MSTFKPKPQDEIVLDQDVYVLQQHPSAPNMVFAQAGKKGRVYKVIHKGHSSAFALKVFVERYRKSTMVDLTNLLASYAQMPGMEVCSREVIHAKGFGADVLKQFPELEYAVLMPWSTGRTWFDVITSKALIAPQVGIEIARRTAEILAGLEALTSAHCDISSGNLLIDVDTLKISLIDVEDMYSPKFLEPEGVPLGTDGYNHKQAREEGQWCAEGDRFSGAVIISEMLCWHNAEVREKASEDGSYFSPKEMQDRDSKHYQLMLDTLHKLDSLPSGINTALAENFRQAWESKSLSDCPDMNSWFSLLKQAAPVPFGTRLTDSEIKWPVIGWKAIPSSKPVPQNPITGFSKITAPQSGLSRAPRLFPVNGHNGRGTFEIGWFPVAGATGYEVSYHQQPDYSDDPVIIECDQPTLSIQNLEKGDYFFRVRAIDQNANGEWSKPLKIVVWRD
jgi:hypothetical protein